LGALVKEKSLERGGCYVHRKRIKTDAQGREGKKCVDSVGDGRCPGKDAELGEGGTRAGTKRELSKWCKKNETEDSSKTTFGCMMGDETNRGGDKKSRRIRAEAGSAMNKGKSEDKSVR